MNGISKSLINTTYGMFKVPASMDISQSAQVNNHAADTNTPQNNTVSENPKKTSKKKFIIAAAVIAASAILVGVGIKTGRFKKLFGEKNKPLPDGIRNGIQKNGDKYTPEPLPLALPEKSSATLAREAADAEKAARRAQKWAEKSKKLGAEAQTKTPLPEVIELGAPEPQVLSKPGALVEAAAGANPAAEPAPLPLALPENSSATLAKRTSELALNKNKHTQLNLAATAFVAGILTKGFKDFRNAQSREIEKLEKFADENRDMIKEEAPRILSEAKEYKDSYDNKTSLVIQEKIEPQVEQMRKRIASSSRIYDKLDTKSHVEFWNGTKDPKLMVNNDGNGTVKFTTYPKDQSSTAQTMTFVNDKPKEIIVYNPINERPLRKALIRQDGDGNNYISQFFVYNKNTGVMTGSMVYDKNNNPKTFFSRDAEGKIRKVYNIDDNNNLRAVALPDEDGKKCDRRYIYNNGVIDKAFISKTDTAPRRIYTFKDGLPEQLDLYGKKVEMPVEGKKKLVDTTFSIPLQ